MLKGWNCEKGIWFYVPEYFTLEEFFPPDCLSISWMDINSRVLITMDRLRERYGTAIMNTWHLKSSLKEIYGTHSYRGWRPRNCEVGAKLSYHKFGCAADMAFAYADVEHIREEILNNPLDPTFEFITCIEMDVNWLHFDVRPHDKANKGILKIFPK